MKRTSHRFLAVTSAAGALALAALLLPSREQTATSTAAIGPDAPAAPAAARVAGPAPRPTLPVAVVIDGASTVTIDTDALAGAAPLEAPGRRAWPVRALIGETGDRAIVARRADGAIFELHRAEGGEPILVERADGSRYVAWLRPGAGPDARLADAELPAQRIEEVVALEARVPEETRTASLTLTLDGVSTGEITPARFRAQATDQVVRKRDVSPAMVVDAVAGGMRVAAIEGRAGRVDLSTTHAGARPMLYLNRRDRFRFDWVDARGQRIARSDIGEVTALVLAR